MKLKSNLLILIAILISPLCLLAQMESYKSSGGFVSSYGSGQFQGDVVNGFNLNIRFSMPLSEVVLNGPQDIESIKSRIKNSFKFMKLYSWKNYKFVGANNPRFSGTSISYSENYLGPDAKKILDFTDLRLQQIDVNLTSRVGEKLAYEVSIYSPKFGFSTTLYTSNSGLMFIEFDTLERDYFDNSAKTTSTPRERMHSCQAAFL